MKKLTFSNWERVWLSVIVSNGTAPTIGQIRLGNKALDILEFSEEEQKIAGLERIGLGWWRWSQEHEWGLDFPDDVWQIIVIYTKNFQQWPQDRRTEALYDKVVQDE